LLSYDVRGRDTVNRKPTTLIDHFSSACWRSAADIDRTFVRHPDNNPSPAEIWRYAPDGGRHVILSVLIPTWDGYRDGYLPKLLAQIHTQSFSDFEILIIKGDARQGRAINIAAACAQGKYLLTLDDDSSVPDTATFYKLIDVMEKHPDIGLAGAANQIPENATAFVKRVMNELPRRATKLVKEITDSDLAEHGCLIMRTAELKCIGGENELIPRGLDPYLRQEYRKAGRRVVVVPGVIYHHLPPVSLGKLLRQFYRNGSQAAFTNRHYPQWVIETPSQHGDFKSHVPFSKRICRFPLRLLGSLICGKPIHFLSEVAYGFGFINGWMREWTHS
jgi:GT2 family glycosyltransferase